MVNFNIFGSCVSRDAIAFASGGEVAQYSARQSIVSAVSKRPSSDVIKRLHLKEGIGTFHQRCIEEDFTKSSLIKLSTRPIDEILFIDLIEERMPLGVTDCRAYISLSEAATLFSNAQELVVDTVKPWSENFVKLFDEAIPQFYGFLEGRPIVIHKAYYAEDRWKFASINQSLEILYSKLIDALHPVSVITVPEELRRSNPNHKWGLGPYHYIDDYYRCFVEQISESLNIPVSPSSSYSLDKGTGH